MTNITKLLVSALLAVSLVIPAFGQANAEPHPLIKQQMVPDTTGTEAQPAENAGTGETETAPAQVQPGEVAPGESGSPVIIPIPVEIIRQMMGGHGPHPAGDPTPEMLERSYKQVWSQVAQHFMPRSKLENWDEWRDKYDGKLTTVEEYETALQAMLGSLNDQWTRYVSTADMTEQRELAQQGFLESGVIVKVDDKGTYSVNSLIYGTAGYNSDLRKDDILKSIAGQQLTPQTTMDEVETLLRAKATQSIDIVYERDGTDHTLTLVVTPPPQEQVEGGLLPGNIGYIRLPSFMPQHMGPFIQGLMGMHGQANANLKGLILDLRGNPGGVYDLAYDVAEIFLNEGTVVTATTREGRHLNIDEERIAPSSKIDFVGVPADVVNMITDFYEVPLVVLIDGSTASSAEILTGALKDNNRATIVGTTTWGKGVGFRQARIPPGGMLSITGLEYVTPSGYNLNKKGIEPHVVVERTAGAAVDAQLDRAIQIIEQTSPNQIRKPATNEADSPLFNQEFTGPLYAAGVVALILLLITWYGVHHHLQSKREREAQEANRKEPERRY